MRISTEVSVSEIPKTFSCFRPVRNSPTGTQQYYHRKIRPDSWQESAFSSYILKQESMWTPCGILCGIFKLAGIYSRNIIMSRNVNQIPARNPARNIMWAQIPARIPVRNLYQITAVIPVQNYCFICWHTGDLFE